MEVRVDVHGVNSCGGGFVGSGGNVVLVSLSK